MKTKTIVHILFVLGLLTGAIALPVAGRAAPNPIAGEVSGTVTYTGSQDPNHDVLVAAHLSTNSNPVASTRISGPDDYTLSLQDGTHYDPVTVNGGNITGIDIILTDPSVAIIVDGSTCTLADAITAANTDTATGGCSAGSGDDTLTITSDIALTEALPAITSKITINGGDHNITGDHSFRIFEVGTAGDLTLNNATISNGSAPRGGGIYNNSGALTVDNSTITNNSAGGGYDGYGGGIYNNSGTVTVSNSTISGNSAAFLGGIFNKIGTETVSNSTI